MNDNDGNERVMLTRIDLTRIDLLEVCVRFVEAWGLIDAPGGYEWRSRIREAGGPEQFHTELEQALSNAISATALSKASGQRASAIATMQADLAHFDSDPPRRTMIPSEYARELLESEYGRPVNQATMDEFTKWMRERWGL